MAHIAAGDIAGAVSNFSVESTDDYRDMFTALEPTIL
jgi:hypothetical protein